MNRRTSFHMMASSPAEENNGLGFPSLGSSPFANSSVSQLERVTHSDVAELHEGYRLLSLNREHRPQSLNIKQMCEVLNAAGLHLHEDEVAEVIRTIDQSGCNAMTFSDFALLMTRQVDEPMFESMKSAFRFYDKQNTGYVTSSQFCEMFASMGEKSSPDELEELMNLADVDASNKIDYVKFLSRLSAKLS